VFASAKVFAPPPPPPPTGKEKAMRFFGEIDETAKNINEGYPVAETAAQLATASYGVPVSGLVGLLSLPMGQMMPNLLSMTILPSQERWSVR